MHCEINEIENDGYYTFTIKGNDEFIGYEFYDTTKFRGKYYGWRSMLIQKKNEEGLYEDLYFLSHLSFFFCPFLKQKLYKRGVYIGKDISRVKPVRYIKMKNGTIYEVCEHNNSIISMMKNDVQFALIKRKYITWRHSQYDMVFDENVENDFGLIILFVRFASYFFRYTRGIAFGNSVIDINTDRLSWKPQTDNNENISKNYVFL